MKSITLQHIIVYSITLWLSSVFFLTYWQMFLNESAEILIKANMLGEFSFEFLLFNFLFIALLIFLTRLLIKYWREK